MKNKIPIYLLAILSLVIIAYGILYLFRNDIMNYHFPYLRMSEEQLSRFNQHIIPLYLTLIWISGSCMIAIGLTSFLIVIGPLRKEEGWAWWLLITLLPLPLIVTTLASYHIAATIPSGPKPPYWLGGLILALFLLVIGFCYPRKSKEAG
jgi:hypothetical protein